MAANNASRTVSCERLLLGDMEVLKKAEMSSVGAESIRILFQIVEHEKKKIKIQQIAYAADDIDKTNNTNIHFVIG